MEGIGIAIIYFSYRLAIQHALLWKERGDIGDELFKAHAPIVT